MLIARYAYTDFDISKHFQEGLVYSLAASLCVSFKTSIDKKGCNSKFDKSDLRDRYE